MHDDRLSPDGAARGGPAHAPLRRRCSTAAGRSSPSTPTGSGRVAEVFGDLDRAAAGLGRRPRRRHRPADLPAHQPQVLGARRHGRSRCTRAERAASPATRTAVIAWADYTAPSGLGMDAATAMRADDGRRAAERAGARRCPAGHRSSLFCHSYGSVVCGVAAHALPRRVTDIAVAGSPGMRVENAAATAHRRPGVGDAGRRRLDRRTCRTWRSAGSDTAPIRCRRPSARACCPRGARTGTAAISSRARRVCSNFAEIGVGAYGAVRCARRDQNDQRPQG